MKRDVFFVPSYRFLVSPRNLNTYDLFQIKYFEVFKLRGDEGKRRRKCKGIKANMFYLPCFKLRLRGTVRNQILAGLANMFRVKHFNLRILILHLSLCNVTVKFNTSHVFKNIAQNILIADTLI